MIDKQQNTKSRIYIWVTSWLQMMQYNKYEQYDDY